MAAIEQGQLRISGIPCDSPPFRLQIRQGFNRHGRMTAGLWIPEETRKELHLNMQVILELDGGGPVFCGVVERATAGKEKGQDCVYLEARTGSCLLDRKKRKRSFQRQGRSYKELAGEVAAPYQGYPVWKTGAGGEKECGFLLQYEETDWEFLRRALSAGGNGLLPESRFPGNGFYIGLPDSQCEVEIQSDHYSIRSHPPGSVLEDGMICTGPEYVLKDCGEMLYPGDRVIFRGQRLAVSGKESRLEGGEVKTTYILRGEDGFRTEAIYNYRLIGASVAGTVLESGPEKSRLSLSTDAEGEPEDSWHSRPIFYSGGGAGYSGRPENGDTLYLYFPTEHEEDRSVIGGGGAGYETLRAVTQQVMEDTAAEEEEAEKNQPLPLGVKTQGSAAGEKTGGSAAQAPEAGRTQKADASNMTGYKNWSTPGKQGVSLNTAGVRLQTGKGSAIGMGKGGMSLNSRGDAILAGRNGIEVKMLSGKQVSLKAEEYIFIQCGMSAVALLPEEIHLKGTRVQLDSLLNGKGETVFSDDAIETLKEMYYNEKWGSPLQLFMPDGTVIGRVKGLEGNAALRKYFEENVLGTEGYVNYLDSELLEPYYEDGTLDPNSRESYENSLYLKWLSATYGKTRMEKAGDWLMTKEGRHASLDVIGVFLEPADVLNAVLYLTEGELGDAALSGISMVPMLGDLFGKGGKGTKYLMKAADVTKLNRSKKVVKVLDSIDIFVKARKADMGELQKWIRKSLDNLANGGDEVVELVTPDGLRIRINGDLRANINLMDETGDMVQDTVRLGNKVDDSGNVLKAESGAKKSLLTDSLKPRYGPRRISDELYNKLRKKTPTSTVRKQVNKGIALPMNDPALPGKTITKPLQADHIVSMDKITRMEGFDKLTFEQQLEILNNPENFVGLSEAANTSKGNKSYAEWTHYKKGSNEEIEISKSFRDEMIKKEQTLEIEIQKQIDELVIKNAGGL